MNRSALSKQISKEQISNLKNNPQEFASFLQHQNDGSIIYILEKLGKLDNANCKKPLLNLLKKNDEKIRALTLKNLAKIQSPSLLKTFQRFATTDKSTEVRREAVSAIGRLRNETAISVLISFLKDPDPKVVMQAIRGLLVFSKNEQINLELLKLRSHPNELIKEIVSQKTSKSSTHQKNNQQHSQFPIYLKNTVVHGDVLKTLKHLPDESIHLTFTSPPYYNARDYSIYQSYQKYLNFLVKVFKEVHRVTKEGRFFVLNTSPIIIPRISRAHSSKRYPIPYDLHPLLVKMGWEFIDDIVWVKPEASVKNRNAGFLQHRKPLAYKPNAISEMIMVYRKKTNKLIDWNIHQYGLEKIKKSLVNNKYETTNIWHIDPTFNKVHSAVFPLELCNRIIKYYSLMEDLIFDPFAGSGTLGLAAMNLQRNFFLAEKEIKYIEYLKENLSKKNNHSHINNAQINFFNLKTFIKSIKDQDDNS